MQCTSSDSFVSKGMRAESVRERRQETGGSGSGEREEMEEDGEERTEGWVG